MLPVTRLAPGARFHFGVATAVAAVLVTGIGCQAHWLQGSLGAVGLVAGMG